MVSVLAAIYAALSGNSSITASLGTYNTNPSIFTRRPVPESASYPMVVVNAPFSIVDDDALSARRSVISLDIVVYGEQDGHYRVVNTIAYLIRNQFHRLNDSLSVSGYEIYEIVTSGPVPAPVDDEEHIGRAVTLNIRIQPE